MSVWFDWMSARKAGSTCPNVGSGGAVLWGSFWGASAAAGSLLVYSLIIALYDGEEECAGLQDHKSYGYEFWQRIWICEVLMDWFDFVHRHGMNCDIDSFLLKEHYYFYAESALKLF